MAIIKIKRGNTVNVSGLSLTAGEPAFVLDTGKLYIGNGTDKVLINPDISNVPSASKLATARNITLTGDITGTASFDGTANASITTSYKNSGVTAGTYPKVTVDAKGVVTSGTTLVATDIPSLDGAKITTGKLPIAVVPTGKTSTTVSLGNHTHSTYVPTTRTINNKALSADISLTATDIGAYTKAEMDAKNFVYGDNVAEFESFDPINAQFLGGGAPEFYAKQSDMDVLNASRGYLNTMNVNQASVNTLTSNGKYMNMSGMPCTGTWVVDVIAYNSTYLTQYASCIYDSEGKGYTGLKFTRDYLGGAWGSWLRYASSDHVMWNYNATGGAKNNVDFNTLTIHGEHQVALGSTNGPTTENYWDIFVFGGGEPTQIAKNIVTGKLYNRVYKSPAWQPWAEIVQESYYIMTNSDLRNSWVIYSQVSVTRQGNLVTIEGVIQGGTRTDGVLAMVLPIGFRPTGIRHIFSLCTPGSGSSKCIGTQIGTDGAVALTYGASDQYVLLNLSFRI